MLRNDRSTYLYVYSSLHSLCILRLKNYSPVTGVKDFHRCWSVPHLPFATCLTFIRYVGVDFTFGLLNCVHYIKYNKDFVISRFIISKFCFIH